MKTSNLIYTIQPKVGEKGMVQVETLVTKGLYRFTILGVNQKQGSDARDRVYSALRASDLFNLKSDNRKITVNLIPAQGLEYDHSFDLAIVLSCMECIHGNLIKDKILALGELSIRGDVIATGRVYQALYAAIEGNIEVIVCSTEDSHLIDSCMLRIIQEHSIRFVTADNLGDLYRKLTARQYHEFAIITACAANDKNAQDMSIVKGLLETEYIKSIFLALAGGHDLAFEASNSTFVGDFLLSILHESTGPNARQLLAMADKTKVSDTEILSRFAPGHVTQIDSQITRVELMGNKSIGLLGKSIFETIFAVDISDFPKNIWNCIAKGERGQIFAVCKSCPCGIEAIPFSGKTQKCTCIQRSIIRHQQYLQQVCKETFTIWTNVSGQITKLTASEIAEIHCVVRMVRELQFERHAAEYGMCEKRYDQLDTIRFLNCYRDPELILKVLSPEALKLYRSIENLYNKDTLHKILRLSQTIADCNAVIFNEKSTAVDMQTVLLSLSYIPRMDF